MAEEEAARSRVIKFIEPVIITREFGAGAQTERTQDIDPECIEPIVNQLEYMSKHGSLTRFWFKRYWDIVEGVIDRGRGVAAMNGTSALRLRDRIARFGLNL